MRGQNLATEKYHWPARSAWKRWSHVPFKGKHLPEAFRLLSIHHQEFWGACRCAALFQYRAEWGACWLGKTSSAGIRADMVLVRAACNRKFLVPLRQKLGNSTLPHQCWVCNSRKPAEYCAMWAPGQHPGTWKFYNKKHWCVHRFQGRNKTLWRPHTWILLWRAVCNVGLPLGGGERGNSMWAIENCNFFPSPSFLRLSLATLLETPWALGDYTRAQTYYNHDIAISWSKPCTLGDQDSDGNKWCLRSIRSDMKRSPQVLLGGPVKCTMLDAYSWKR